MQHKENTIFAERNSHIWNELKMQKVSLEAGKCSHCSPAWHWGEKDASDQYLLDWQELWEAKSEDVGSLTRSGRGCLSSLDPCWRVRRWVCWEMEAERVGGGGEDYEREKISFATNMFSFLSLSSSECLHLHESWLLSSSTNDEMREGMPDSLSAYYKSCWEVWSLFSSPGCPPATHIFHFFHLFMTFLWPQTYAMSPGEMEAKSHFTLTCVAENSPIVLPCSAHPPQENKEYKCTDWYEEGKKYEHSPLLSYSLPSFRRGLVSSRKDGALLCACCPWCHTNSHCEWAGFILF